MTPATLKHFLLVFDPATGREARVDVFEHAGPALDAYRDAERRFRGQQGIQVVLIGADSLATIRRTHSNYFDDTSIQGVKTALRQRSRRTAV